MNNMVGDSFKKLSYYWLSVDDVLVIVGSFWPQICFSWKRFHKEELEMEKEMTNHISIAKYAIAKTNKRIESPRDHARCPCIGQECQPSSGVHICSVIGEHIIEFILPSNVRGAFWKIRGVHFFEMPHNVFNLFFVINVTSLFQISMSFPYFWLWSFNFLYMFFKLSLKLNHTLAGNIRTTITLIVISPPIMTTSAHYQWQSTIFFYLIILSIYLDRHIKNVLVEYFVLDFIVSLQREHTLHTCKIWDLILL